MAWRRLSRSLPQLLREAGEVLPAGPLKAALPKPAPSPLLQQVVSQISTVTRGSAYGLEASSPTTSSQAMWWRLPAAWEWEPESRGYLYVNTTAPGDETPPDHSQGKGGGGGNGDGGQQTSPPTPPPQDDDDDGKGKLLKLLLKLQKNVARLLEGEDFDPKAVDVKNKNGFEPLEGELKETRALVEALLQELQEHQGHHAVVVLLHKLSTDLGSLEAKILSQKQKAAGAESTSWMRVKLEEKVGKEHTERMFHVGRMMRMAWEFGKGKYLLGLTLSAAWSAEIMPLEGFQILVMLFKRARDERIDELKKLKQENKDGPKTNKDGPKTNKDGPATPPAPAQDTPPAPAQDTPPAPEEGGGDDE